MLNRGLDKQELLRIVDSVATEKSIDKEIILKSMETAIQKAAYSKFGSDNEIEATINRDNGSIKIQKVLQIVEKVEDPVREILLKDANLLDRKNKDLKVGDKVYEELPQVDFGRIAAQSAKQVISQRVREAEKNRQQRDQFTTRTPIYNKEPNLQQGARGPNLQQEAQFTRPAANNKKKTNNKELNLQQEPQFTT